jgi:hypothetical protein
MRHFAQAFGRALAIAALLLVIATPLFAQSEQGAISGTILDSSGGAVPGAEVTAKGVTTGTQYSVTSSSTGAYRFANMIVGAYDLSVTATGFKVSSRTGVLVQIDTTNSLDITLQPGDVKETLTVVADAPMIQTQTSDVGTVVDMRQIEELPLSVSASGQSFLRSPEAFVFLTPGTAGPGTNSDHGSAGTFETKLAGGQNFGTEVIFDGVSTSRMDTSSAFDQTAPSVEALADFKVMVSTIPADYGRTSGGIESFGTRSGSNSFHGAAFELFRNTALDANSWYNDWVNANASILGFTAPKPSDHKNDYGGTFGGPVWIPKLYDGRNKTFFFFAWEQYRQKVGSTVTSTLPTMAERQGDFSALLGSEVMSNGSPVINPCTGQPVLQGQIFDPSTTQTIGGVQCRSPFPNNQIPTSDFSKVDQKVLTYLPTLPANAPLINNFIYNGTNSNLDTAMTVRIDQNLGANDKFFFTYNKRDYEAPNGASNLPGPLNNNYLNSNITWYYRFGWDHVFGDNIVNHFVAGLNRIYHFSLGASVTGVDWNQVLGIGNATGEVFPQFGFNGSPNGIGYVGFSTPQNNGDIPNSLVLNDSVSWVKGRHTFRAGLEWRSYQFSVPSEAYTSPSYSFYNYQTSYTPGDIHTGDPFASYILGAPQQETLTVYSHYPRWDATYFAAYVQDDFKFRRDLTLNLGFRYSIDTPRSEADSAQSNINLNAYNPGTPGQLGALVYGAFASLGNTYFKNFGPRVGFAYAPDELFGHIHNIVVRGGYTIYYAPLVYSDFGGSYTSGATASPNFQSVDNFSAQQSPDAGFPAYTPPSNSQDPTLQNGQNPNYVAPQYGKPGMVQNWNLEVQHQIAPDLILSVGYIGLHSTRLHSALAGVDDLNPSFYNLNGASPSCGSGATTYGPSVLTQPYSSCQGQAALANLGVTVPSWFPTVYPASAGGATVAQVLRPYPQYNGITTNGGIENLGQSTYNAGMVKLERRFRNGLNLLASYTFSKTLTDADSTYPLFTSFNSGVWAQDSFNLKNSKSVSYQDVPQIFVLSYLYELPVGPTKKFVNKGGVVGKIVGGWQVGGVQRYQSGSPVSFGCSATSIPGNSGDICFDRVSGQPFLAPTSGSFNGPDAYIALLTARQNNPSGNYGYGIGQTLPPGAVAYFNTAGFADTNSAANLTARGYAFGNISRTLGNIRSADYYNEDFSVIKRTPIFEGQSIVFKAEFLNAFNRHTFSVPDSGPYDSTFGIPGGGGSGMIVNAPKAVQLQLRYEF